MLMWAWLSCFMGVVIPIMGVVIAFVGALCTLKMMAVSSRGEPSTSQLLSTSWFDSAGIASLNQYNVLDYFSQLTNPFYDRTCNNEVIKMQRADPAQLINMTGVEYHVLHVQEPILYVIRKANRQSQNSLIPLAHYYVLGGVVYQCPDLWSIINSRLLSAISRVNEAFNEAISYSRYDPTKGYQWEFPNDKSHDSHVKKQPSQKEEPSDVQRRKVDNLLTDLVRKFPPKAFARKDGSKPVVVGSSEKQEKSKSSEVTKEPAVASAATSVGVKRAGQFVSDKQPDPKRKRT